MAEYHGKYSLFLPIGLSRSVEIGSVLTKIIISVTLRGQRGKNLHAPRPHKKAESAAGRPRRKKKRFPQTQEGSGRTEGKRES